MMAYDWTILIEWILAFSCGFVANAFMVELRRKKAEKVARRVVEE